MSQGSQPTLAIGVTPRERYSVAARSLQSILDHTALDYELIVVDNCTPRRYWAQIEAVLAGRDNVRIIRTESVLLPGPCKELVVEAATQELICLTENDVIVTEGWLSSMLDALQQSSADVVAPLVLEDSIDSPHGDLNVGAFRFQETEEGIRLEIDPIAEMPEQLGELNGLTEVEVVENHCLLFRAEALRRIRPFAEPLSAREFIDTCLALKKGGARVVLQPASRVIFMSPPPVERDELPFYRQKWDLQLARWSHERIKQKWGLAAFPEAMRFVMDRMRRRSRWYWAVFSLQRRTRAWATGFLRREVGRLGLQVPRFADARMRRLPLSVAITSASPRQRARERPGEP